MTTPAIVEQTAGQPVPQPSATTPEVLELVQATPDLVPAAAPPTPPPSSAPPAEPGTPSPIARQEVSTELADARRQLAQFQADKQQQELDTAVAQETQAKYREALARGVSEEDALWMAESYRSMAHRVSQERQQLQQQQQNLIGKQRAALFYGKQYGVDPGVLMTANTQEEMMAIGEREKRYMAQEVRLKALEQARVPAQTLNASNGSRAGAITVTSDNIDQLWLEHEMSHPDGPNPYEATYRRLMGR